MVNKKILELKMCQKIYQIFRNWEREKIQLAWFANELRPELNLNYKNFTKPD